MTGLGAYAVLQSAQQSIMSTDSRASQVRIAVVTGGARGIGRAVGEWFLRRGYKVVSLDREDAVLNKAAEEIGRPDELNVGKPREQAPAAAVVAETDRWSAKAYLFVGH